MALKTLHLTNAWHETSGGIATFYRALIEAASAREQYIRLVVPGESTRVEDVSEFARIYYVRAPRSPFNPQYRTIYPGQFLNADGPIQKILCAERPGIVEICDKYTLNYLGGLLRRGLLPSVNFRPVVLGLSCERMDDNFRTYIGALPGAQPLCAAYIRWLYFPFFDHHIAVSAYVAEELRGAASGHMVPRNVWIRPMGVDLQRFSPHHRSIEARRALLQSLGAPDDAAILLYAGRLAPEKNLPLLFETFARLTGHQRSAGRAYRLIVAGDGVERGRWQKFCAERAPGLVSFLGHVKDGDALAGLLANADAFIHPNPREPFGIAPLEAMASGLPVVIPNAGGVSSYANPENAWVSPPDSESFAAAVMSLLRDPDEARRRAAKALRTAAAFSWETAAASFLDLYAALDRAATAAADEPSGLPAPAFTSTPACGLGLALSRGASRFAERAFRFASQAGAASRSGRELRDGRA